MPVFFLTQDNCDFVKRRLRQDLPSIKSAHLTEALASALGFRTNAALRVALPSQDAERPPLIRIDTALWLARLRELGYASSDPAFLVEAARAPDLPVGVWREFRNGDIVANNTWFRDCERRDIPNVYIELRTKYARLNWDCISIIRSNDDHVREKQADALVDIMFKRYQALAKGDPARSLFEGSAFIGWIDRLSPQIARTIADDFFQRLYRPLVRQEAPAG
jgi:hypothetical protein